MAEVYHEGQEDSNRVSASATARRRRVQRSWEDVEPIPVRAEGRTGDLTSPGRGKSQEDHH